MNRSKSSYVAGYIVAERYRLVNNYDIDIQYTLTIYHNVAVCSEFDIKKELNFTAQTCAKYIRKAIVCESNDKIRLRFIFRRTSNKAPEWTHFIPTEAFTREMQRNTIE